jgi:hypothetical protein
MMQRPHFAQKAGAIQIKTQGSNHKLLEGAYETICRHRLVICLEHDARCVMHFGDVYRDDGYFFRFADHHAVAGALDDE